jgi:hypothetical protein
VARGLATTGTSAPPGPSRRVRKLAPALLGTALSAVLSLGLAACGGGSDSSSADASAPFPSAKGKTLDQVLNGSNAKHSDLVASPAGEVYSTGKNRLGFGVFTVSRQQVTNGTVALYAAPAGGGKAVGPFPAHEESLAVQPQFESQTTKTDPDAAKAVYVSDVTFAHEGNWNMVAMFRQGTGYSATLMPTIHVGSFKDIPTVGQKPPRIHTPTAASVNGKLTKIDTRTPPDDMHAVDFANVLGKKPVVLLFATPALCQSRVCGPVVDVAEEVEHETGNSVAFIHQEVYNHNNASDGYRPQLQAFGLRSEPWLFVVDRKGIIRTRIEGAFSATELQRAVQQVSG